MIFAHRVATGIRFPGSADVYPRHGHTRVASFPGPLEKPGPKFSRDPGLPDLWCTRVPGPSGLKPTRLPPGPPGPVRPQKCTPQIPARLPSSTQAPFRYVPCALWMCLAVHWHFLILGFTLRPLPGNRQNPAPEGRIPAFHDGYLVRVALRLGSVLLEASGALLGGPEFAHPHTSGPSSLQHDRTKPNTGPVRCILDTSPTQ
jgi:hypothetical protein